MTPNQIRQKYLQFFEQKGHVAIPSAPLVPENDPTTLFTGSGMQPLLQNFLGEPHPQGKRIVDSQKCFRSQDIEEVGDNRHTTFFEMLGNWSFGDYFKTEQIEWIFSFLVEELQIDPNRLYVSAYSGDESLGVPKDEKTIQLWQDLFTSRGISAEIVENPDSQGLSQNGRIFLYQTSNWWSRTGSPQSMPAGEPGGPDSEIFFDFGPQLQLHQNSQFKSQPCHPNCDCGRFLEIGNSVFMQYQKQTNGSFKELPAKNVDFGGGLERIAAVANQDPDVFKTELFWPIIQQLEKLSKKSYQDISLQKAFRVIADHLKAAVMLAADGVFPSNKDQGYFSRRLIRRSVRHGKNLGLETNFLTELLEPVVEMYDEQYPETRLNFNQISQALNSEESKFRQTLTRGLKEFSKISNQIDAQTLFNLYETHGFPLELSLEEAAQRGLEILPNIHQQFQELRAQHAAKSRTASAGKFKGGLADTSEIVTRYHTATHLLHAALRQVLGNLVEQKGSNITDQRLRFDFSFPTALSDGEISKVEALVNGWIDQELTVIKQTTSKKLALDSGALAFFAEKYPDQVDVYSICSPDGSEIVSKELCGGPHVENTNQLGRVEVFKQKAIGAGLRRVYARFQR